jgi:hypothetical protein
MRITPSITTNTAFPLCTQTPHKSHCQNPQHRQPSCINLNTTRWRAPPSSITIYRGNSHKTTIIRMCGLMVKAFDFDNQRNNQRIAGSSPVTFDTSSEDLHFLHFFPSSTISPLFPHGQLFFPTDSNIGLFLPLYFCFVKSTSYRRWLLWYQTIHPAYTSHARISIIVQSIIYFGI